MRQGSAQLLQRCQAGASSRTSLQVRRHPYPIQPAKATSTPGRIDTQSRRKHSRAAGVETDIHIHAPSPTAFGQYHILILISLTSHHSQCASEGRRCAPLVPLQVSTSAVATGPRPTAESSTFGTDEPLRIDIGDGPGMHGAFTGFQGVKGVLGESGW